mgnify:CR=1 FL=1
MKSKLQLVILVILSALMSCEEMSDVKPTSPDDLFYFNSFESASDTIGWYGVFTGNFVKDAPRTGGKNSLKISGGCVIPHAYYTFDPLEEDGSFILKCWGKNLSNGGSLTMQTQEGSGGIHISVSKSSWKEYTSEDTLHAAAGSNIRLELYSGGFLSSSMLVDEIEIIEAH